MGFSTQWHIILSPEILSSMDVARELENRHTLCYRIFPFHDLCQFHMVTSRSSVGLSSSFPGGNQLTCASAIMLALASPLQRSLFSFSTLLSQTSSGNNHPTPPPPHLLIKFMRKTWLFCYLFAKNAFREFHSPVLFSI